MADRNTGHGDPSGTEAGTDVEPLRGGMREVEQGRKGAQGGDVPPEHPAYPGEEHDRETPARKEPPRETTEEKDPAAPYHVAATPAGGLAPRATPGQGTAPQQPTSGALEATAGEKIAQERKDFEDEAGTAPRTDPAARGVDE